MALNIPVEGKAPWSLLGTSPVQGWKSGSDLDLREIANLSVTGMTAE